MIYSQNNEKYKNLKIKGKYKFSEYGCLVVAISWIMELDPEVCLKILNDNDCFTDSGILIWDLACKALGASYGGKIFSKPKGVCIMETDHFKNRGVPQHFVVWLTKGKILDPLTGNKITNPYHVVSYRLFKKKPKLKPKETIKKLPNPIVGQKLGSEWWLIKRLKKIFMIMLSFLRLKK